MPTKIDAPRAWSVLRGPNGRLNWYTCADRESVELVYSDDKLRHPNTFKPIPVRIIRESDYRRLLAAARKGGLDV